MQIIITADVGRKTEEDIQWAVRSKHPRLHMISPPSALHRGRRKRADYAIAEVAVRFIERLHVSNLVHLQSTSRVGRVFYRHEKFHSDIHVHRSGSSLVMVWNLFEF